MAGDQLVVDLTKGISRRIYGNWIRSLRVNSVSLEAEVLLLRLILLADDFGNLLGDPDILRSDVFPRRKVTADRLAGWLDELCSTNPPLVVRYKSGGETYLHVLEFAVNQPTKNGRRVRRFPPEVIPVNPGESGGIRVNPGNPNESSVLQVQVQVQEQVQEQSGGDQPGFERFWDEYPKGARKVDRKACAAKWRSSELEPLADKILDGLRRWKRSRDWCKNAGEFVCAPLVFLNQARWEADPPAASSLPFPGSNGETRNVGVLPGGVVRG